MELHKKLHFITKQGIKIFPDLPPGSSSYKKFAIRVVDQYNVLYKKKSTVGKYKHTTKTINKALELAVNEIYKLLNKTK